MPAGCRYDLNPQGVDKEAVNFESVYRLSGGFNLEDSDLVNGSHLPSLTPLCVNFATRKAKAVKNVKVVEDLTADGTSMKIRKGSLAYVGMFLGNGKKGTTISAIDKTNANYDTLTITALTVTVTKDEVLFEASAVGGTLPKCKANCLNYARVKVEPGATVAAIGKAFEIRESKLTLPVSEVDKTNLGDRFMFVY